MPKKKQGRRTRMFSFRLDPNNAREEAVIQAFDELVNEETGIREIVTAAVLSFQGKRIPDQAPERVMMRQLRAALVEFHALLGEARDFYARGESATPEYQEQEQDLRHRLTGAVSGMISAPKVYDEE